MRSLDELDRLLKEAQAESAQLTARQADVLNLIRDMQQERAALLPVEATPLRPDVQAAVTNESSQEAKIALFRSLFRGREDVYPRRFESQKTGKTGYQPACRNPWIDNPAERELLPLTDEVVRNHLLGADLQDRSGRDFTIGVYPMLPDETCWFLAADFDKASWPEDTRAFLQTCRHFQVPAVLERSRSGNGGHVWIFFAEPVPVAQARKVGAFLLSQTMERRPEVGLDSYDRFFPSQDTLPTKGFGNLIALPLQKKPRVQGNSLFLDDNYSPYADQWSFLASIRRMGGAEIEALANEADKLGELWGVRLPVTEEADDKPWTAPPSRRRKDPPIVGPLPKQIDLVLGNQLYVPKADLSPSLRNRLIRLAAFQNPDFYQTQAMRLSTFGKPRIISCCEDFPKHLGMPRGCLDEVLVLFESLKTKVSLTDERVAGSTLDIVFHGALGADQQQAADALLEHETGVLAASTAFGKTVVAAYLIAARKVNTLVIVHRRQLLDQWVGALSRFLDLSPKEIGQVGGGKRRPTGKLDVAMVQSLGRKGIVDDIVGEYGHLVVDECHHISAVSFEQVVRQSKAKYITGLSATISRKDGHHPIIFMQCGPVRYRADDPHSPCSWGKCRQQAAKRPFDHRVVIRPTAFQLPSYLQSTPLPPIQEMYAMLAEDIERNHLIVQDVIAAVEANRCPVLLTERRGHLETLAALLSQKVQNVVVMAGGMGKRQRTALAERVAGLPADQPRVIVATGRYLGEGFDDERLDTLFLALPISWRGTLTQYAGRLHRLNAAKREVVIYDYVDFEVPMMAKMYSRRRAGYKAMGYQVALPEKKDQTAQLSFEQE